MVHRKLLTPLLLVPALFMAIFVADRLAYAEATITINNDDGAGEGFNDTSAADPDSTAGGNDGSTLGAQRLIAFQFAANIWAARVDSTVEIKVDADMNPLTCSATSAILGSAGPIFVIRDFTGALVANTWYPEALANSLAGTDLIPSSSDIVATFNSSIGTTCEFPNVWYYGLDANPPGSKIDFVTVVLHEIGHGLGFLTFVELRSGRKLLSRDDTYMLNLEDHSTGNLYPTMSNGQRKSASKDTGDLHWVGPNVVAGSVELTGGVGAGGHVEMYAPNPQEAGSSVSHFSDSLGPDELMEPFFTDVNHDPGLAAALMTDIGWPCASSLDLTAGEWALISLPCNPAPNNTVDDVFGDDLLGTYAVDWAVFERDHTNQVYVEKALTDPLTTGRGYWIKTNLASQTVITEGIDNPVIDVPLVSDTTDGAGCGTSAGRCNMVGHPHKFNVCWADVKVIDGASTLSLSDADPDGACQNPNAFTNDCVMSRIAHKWTGSSYAPFDGETPGMEGTLVPWDGFWVSAVKSGIELRIPATQGNCGAPAALATTSSAPVLGTTSQAGDLQSFRSEAGEPDIHDGWFIRLIAEAGEMRDDANVFGQLPDSKKGYDSHDLPELDPFGDDFLTVVFPHPKWKKQAGNYASDFHRLRGHKTKDKWKFEIRSSQPGAEVTLSWEGPDDKLAYSTLVDRETKEKIPVFPGDSYTFTMNGSIRSFVWEIR